jgi:hypothetical protein
MRFATLLAAALLFASPAVAGKFEKLEPAEQMHFRALEVFMDKGEIKQFFKLKEKSERDAYLQELGLWDRFYRYDAEQQKMVVNAEVRLGFTRDQLYMAWAAPFSKQRLTGRPAERSERLVYRFEVDKDGYATPLGRNKNYKAVDRYQVEVIIDDDVVTEMKEKDTWD